MCIRDSYRACFTFSSGTTKTITIRNNVAAVSNNLIQPCNLEVFGDELVFKMALSGLKSPVMAIASGEIEVKGGNTEFLQFLSSFR